MLQDLSGLKDFFWLEQGDIPRVAFVCGFCGTYVGAEKGFDTKVSDRTGSRRLDAASLVICPMCNCPSIFYWGNEGLVQFPLPAPGRVVSHVPTDLDALYQEARAAAGAGAFTGAVLLCRKLLMNIAVSEGASEGAKFIHYVDYLCDKGYVPPNGRTWVDYIRRRGNEATHEIQLMTKDDAEKLLTFTEMLLRFVYEFPHMAGQPVGEG